MAPSSKTEEIKALIAKRVKEIDGKAREGAEKLWGQAQEAHDRLLDKTSTMYEKMLLKAEERIREHRETVAAGELQEQIVERIKEGIEKIEKDHKELSAQAVEALTLDITSDLTMLWYHRDFMERKLKEEEEG